MGYFDNAILRIANNRMTKKLTAVKEGIYTDFFKDENLKNAYDYQNLKRFFSDKTGTGATEADKEKYSSYSEMEIHVRRRLIYFLLLAEIDANPNLTMEQLVDNTSPEGIQRKRAAADKVKDWFNSEITSTKELANLVVDNGKKFKTMFNSVVGADFSDEKATIEKMDELGSLTKVHFDAVHQLGRIGVSDEDMIDNAKVVLLFQATSLRNSFLSDITRSNINRNSEGIKRGITLQRMFAMAIPHKAVTTLNDEALLATLSTTAEVENLTAMTDFMSSTIKKVDTGIYGKLTDNELAKLAFIPSLSEKIKIDYAVNGDANDMVKITFDGETIFDYQDKTVLADDNERVIAIKNVIREEYNKYLDKELSSTVGLDCFGEKETVEWLINDMKAAGEQLVTDLANNTRLGKSSSYYRAMQKAAKDFNKALSNVDVKNFNDEEGRRQIKEQLKALTATMEGYLAHKDLNNVQYTDPYVLGRINLAKSSLETFDRFHRCCESADRYHLSQAMWHKNDKAILYKYNAMREEDAKSSESNMGDALKEMAINDAKMAAYEINKLAYSRDSLNAEERKSVVDNFEKMCALCIVSGLRNMKDAEVKNAFGSLNDEKLLERIRGTEIYKELFADPSKIDGNLARRIIGDELEYEVRAEFKRGIAKEIMDKEPYKEYRDVVNDTARDVMGLNSTYNQDEVLATYIAEHLLMDKIIEKNSPEDKYGTLVEKRDRAINMVKEAVEYKNDILDTQAYKGVIEVYRGAQSPKPEAMYELFLKLDSNPLDAEKIIKEEYEKLNPGKKYVPLQEEILENEALFQAEALEGEFNLANETFRESINPDNQYNPVKSAIDLFRAM